MQRSCGSLGKAWFYGAHREGEGKTDEYMVVYHNYWTMASASSLYPAEIRDFHVTAKELPGGQFQTGHHRNQ